MTDNAARGRDLEREGDVIGAERAYRESALIGEPDGSLYLGVLLARQGRSNESEEAFRHGVAAGDHRCSCELAWLHEQRGDLDGARQLYLDADRAGFAGGAFRLGQLCFDSGDLDGAMRWTARADELGDGEASFNLGVLLTKAGREDEAMDAYRRADARGDVSGAVAYGRALHKRGDHLAAESTLRRACAHNSADAYAALGALLHDVGRRVEADIAFAKATELGHSGFEEARLKSASEMKVLIEKCITYARCCSDLVDDLNAALKPASNAVGAREMADHRPQHEISIAQFVSYAEKSEHEFVDLYKQYLRSAESARRAAEDVWAAVSMADPELALAVGVSDEQYGKVGVAVHALRTEFGPTPQLFTAGVERLRAAMQADIFSLGEDGFTGRVYRAPRTSQQNVASSSSAEAAPSPWSSQHQLVGIAIDHPIDYSTFGVSIAEAVLSLQKLQADLERERLVNVAAAQQRADKVLRSFEPNPHTLELYDRAAERLELQNPGDLPVVSSLEDAIRGWRIYEDRCRETLRSYDAQKFEYEHAKKKVFGRKSDPPVLSSEFTVSLQHLRAIAAQFPALRDAHYALEVGSVRERLEEAHRELVAKMRAEVAQRVEAARDHVGQALGRLGPSALPWAEALGSPTLPQLGVTRLGEYDVSGVAQSDLVLPCLAEFPHQRSMAIEMSADREGAIGLARSIVLRTMCSVPAGRLHTTFVDPMALGRSVADFLHLADHDERLVGTKPWVASGDIEIKLAEHTAHVELVISKYLRGQFESIHDYNAAAGEMAEPFKLLVVFDFPTGFTERATENLLSLIENGPRCGVYTLVLFDANQPPSRDVGYDRLLRRAEVLRWQSAGRLRLSTDGYERPIDILPEMCPPIEFDNAGNPSTPAAEALAGIGTSARAAGSLIVDLPRTLDALNRAASAPGAQRVPELRPGADPLVHDDPATWWQAVSSRSVVAPFGRAGASGVASLYFSSTEIAGGAIVVGLPRSGKTTALHAAILSMCMLYSPSELELYLIDAKHGVEFQTYATLPHARMVSINSEREFSVCVLESLDHEIARRAELMKRSAAASANIEEYRSATGEELPRVIAIIDEFHELFEEADNLGHRAFAAFSNIVRQGPFAGVHLVVASQTLSSMPALDRNTLTLLPARVAFACNETDAQIVMGDANPDVRFLSRQGEGILNPNRGDAAYNQRFQGLFVSSEDRRAIVQRLGVLASSYGRASQPKVFDGAAMASRYQLSPIAAKEAAQRPNRLEILAGTPFSLEEHARLVLRREAGANLLLVGRGGEDGLPDAGTLGVFHSGLLAAAAQSGSVAVVDFLGDEGGLASEGSNRRVSVEELCNHLGLRYLRPRALAEAVDELLGLGEERQLLQDFRSPVHTLLLFGLHRATALNPDDYTDGEPLSGRLSRLLRHGPEVGIHTIVTCDSLSALQRKLGSSDPSEFALRVAGSHAAESDRQQLLSSYQRIDLRVGQMVAYNHDLDQLIRFQPYGPVPEAWMHQLPTPADTNQGTSHA